MGYKLLPLTYFKGARPILVTGLSLSLLVFVSLCASVVCVLRVLWLC